MPGTDPRASILCLPESIIHDKIQVFSIHICIHEAVKYWYNLALAFSLYLKQPKDLPRKSGIEGLETEKFTRDHQYSLVKVAE